MAPWPDHITIRVPLDTCIATKFKGYPNILQAKLYALHLTTKHFCWIGRKLELRTYNVLMNGKATKSLQHDIVHIYLDNFNIVCLLTNDMICHPPSQLNLPYKLVIAAIFVHLCPNQLDNCLHQVVSCCTNKHIINLCTK